MIILSSSLYLVEVLGSVLVGHVGGTDVELEVWPKVFEVVIVGQFWEEGRGGEGRGGMNHHDVKRLLLKSHAQHVTWYHSNSTQTTIHLEITLRMLTVAFSDCPLLYIV